MSTPLLSIRDLSVNFSTPEGTVCAVQGVDLKIDAGECIGIVGESGSGKSQLLLALLGLNAANGTINGSIEFDGEELVGASPRRLNALRGDRMSMIFQDPMTSLNPYRRIGAQLTEGLRQHRGTRARAARERALEMLKAVHMTEAERRLDQFPHELSGGMRQRVMIAMSLICEPALILADEPTTALDVTVQAQILALLRELSERFGTAVVLVTHDLGVVAEIADRVGVMYGGRLVETARVDALFASHRHPYTEALLESVPRLDGARAMRLTTIPGSPPNLLHPPPGCSFAPRCRYRAPLCVSAVPALLEVGPETGHRSACYRAEGLLKTEVAA